MKLLITGIAGFLGTRLARFFTSTCSDVRIWGLDNLSRRGSELNLPVLRHLGCRVHHGDLRLRSDLDDIPPVDWVIDCAANPSVLAGVDGGARALVEHNLMGTLHLLEKCRQDGSGMVLISTSRVYSINALRDMPLRPDASRFVLSDREPLPRGLTEAGVGIAFSTEAPVSLYGGTKLACEIMALEYWNAFGMPLWIDRCGVLAGAGQFGKPDQGIFSYWVHMRREGRPLSYIGHGGTGLQVRDCLHPDDLGRLVAAQLRTAADRTRSPIYNVGGGMLNSMSLRELNRWCDGRFGPATVGSQPESRTFDVPWLVMDPRAASDRWGWKPAVGLTDVLEEIAAHAEAHPDWLSYCNPPE